MELELAHRFIFTENCNRSCAHCFNADVRDGKVLPADEFIEWLQLNSLYLGNQQLKIMGGEPTIHKHFMYMTVEALRHYSSVLLFSNGTTIKDVIENRHILKAHFQNRFGFIINGLTATSFSTDLFNNVSLHIVVPFDQQKLDEMIDKVIEFSRDLKFHFIVSGDTSVNVLDEDIARVYRDCYLKFYQRVIPYIAPRYSFDHPFPSCFWTQDLIDELHKIGVGPVHLHPACCDRVIGLIDTNWNLHYCNQTRLELTNIKGKTIPEINEMIQSAPMYKVELLKEVSEKCRSCPAVITCKARCWCRQLQK